MDTQHWPSPHDHNLDLLIETFTNQSIVQQYINNKAITRPKYMFGRDKIIAINDTVQRRKESQYLASLSVAIFFLHKIRDIPPNSTQKQLWYNIIHMIIYLIDNGANIDESFVFYERSPPNAPRLVFVRPRADWILYTPLYLTHVLLSYIKTKYNNNASMKFKQESITNLYHYMIRNCCDSSQLPSIYTIRIYVDKDNKYQRGFDHRFFGNIFKKIPNKQEIHNLLLRGIEPFKLCTRFKAYDFLVNIHRKENILTLSQLKQISGADFDRFVVPIYIYALVQQFTCIHNELLLLLKQFNHRYGVFDDIWNCVLSFMYQDVNEFCAPKMDLMALKKSILTNIYHVNLFQNESDFEFWLMDILNDMKFIKEIDTITLLLTWNTLMRHKLWKSIQQLSLIITHRDDFGSYIQQNKDIATDLLNMCCHLTLHSTHFIDIFYEIQKHFDTLADSKYFTKLKFCSFIKHVFGHLNKMENSHNTTYEDIEDDNHHDNDTDEHKNEGSDDEDWNITDDEEVEDEDTNTVTYYMNHMTRKEIVDKAVIICERMYALGAFKPIKKRKLLVDVLANAQAQGCVDIIKVLVKNSWDINGVIDGSRFGWSLQICAEYNVHDEVLQYIFSLEPRIAVQWQEMYLFLYLIQIRSLHLDDDQLIKFCQYLEIYAENKGLTEVLFCILSQKVSFPKNADVLKLFQDSGKYPKFSEYLECWIDENTD